MSGRTGDVDGRRARGEARRRRLVEATLAVVGRDGVGGLSHRTIAEEAEVSLASVGYHFAGVDDLLETALREATVDLVRTLRADGHERSLTGLARYGAEELAARRDLVIAEYELYLLAARRPELAPAALSWLDALTDHVAPSLEGDRRAAFQATVEGVLLHALVRPGPPDAAAMEATLRAAWPDLA